MMPVGYEQRAKTSPVFNYPYARTREALEKMRKAEDWDPAGLKLRYVNPVDGGWAMPTIGTFMQLLPKGFRRFPTARPTARCSPSSKARARPLSPAMTAPRSPSPGARATPS